MFGVRYTYGDLYVRRSIYIQVSLCSELDIHCVGSSSPTLGIHLMNGVKATPPKRTKFSPNTVSVASGYTACTIHEKHGDEENV